MNSQADCKPAIEIIENTGEATGEEVLVLAKGLSQSPNPYRVLIFDGGLVKTAWLNAESGSLRIQRNGEWTAD